MGIAERKEREKQELRERILAAATTMFLEKGFEKTSIRNIAEAVEYSPATLYLHFKDKSELFLALQERGFTLLFSTLAPLNNEPDPMERLRLTGHAYLQFAMDNPAWYDLMFIMRTPMQNIEETEAWHCGLKTHELLSTTVEECINTGAMPKMDLHVATIMVWGFVHGMVAMMIRDRMKMYEGTNLKEAMHQAVDGMMAMVKNVAV